MTKSKGYKVSRALLTIVLALLIITFGMFTGPAADGSLYAHAATKTITLGRTSSVSVTAGDYLSIKGDGWIEYTIKKGSTTVDSGSSDTSTLTLNKSVNTSSWTSGTYTLTYKVYSVKAVTRMVRYSDGSGGYMTTYEKTGSASTSTVSISCTGKSSTGTSTVTTTTPTSTQTSGGSSGTSSTVVTAAEDPIRITYTSLSSAASSNILTGPSTSKTFYVDVDGSQVNSTCLQVWSSNPAVATVEFVEIKYSDRLYYKVTGMSAGNATIYVSDGSTTKSGTFGFYQPEITVDPVEFTLNSTESASATIKCTKKGSSYSPTLSIYSFNSAVAELTANSNSGFTIKAKKAGTTYISITDPATYANKTVMVTVKGPEIQCVDSITLPFGGTETVNATLSQNNEAFGISYSSSSPYYFSVDANGVVTANRVGKANLIVTETYSGVTKSIPVVIEKPVMTAEPMTVYIGAKVNTVFSITPAEHPNYRFTYSPDNYAIVSVDYNTGVITAKKEGTFNLTVRESGTGAEVKIPVTVTLPVIEATDMSVAVGDTMSAAFHCAQAEQANYTFAYTSDNPEVAAIDENGMITGIAAGTANITVVENTTNVTASLVVTVAEPKLEITGKNSVSISADGTKQLEYEANTSGIQFISSDESVVTVDENGVVKGIKPGKAMVVAKDKFGNTVKWTVKVKIPVKTSATVNAVTVKWDAADGATAYKVYRSTSKSGDFTKIAEIKAGETLKYIDKKPTAGKTYYYKVKPVGVDCTSEVVKGVKLKPTITLSAKKVTVDVTKTKKIEVSGLAKGDEVKSWKSADKSIATVTSKGTIKGMKKGTTTVTVTLKSGKTAKVEVTVKAIPIKLNNKTLTLKKGKTSTLKLEGTTQKITWTSSDKSIATVSSSGKVTAKKPGKCTIKAKVGDKTYSCKVTVTYSDGKPHVIPKITTRTSSDKIRGFWIDITNNYSQGDITIGGMCNYSWLSGSIWSGSTWTSYHYYNADAYFGMSKIKEMEGETITIAPGQTGSLYVALENYTYMQDDGHTLIPMTFNGESYFLFAYKNGSYMIN